MPVIVIFFIIPWALISYLLQKGGMTQTSANWLSGLITVGLLFIAYKLWEKKDR